MAESFEQLTIKKKRTVEVGAVLFVVDSVPWDRFCALDYLLCFNKEGETSTKVFKVLARKTDLSLEDSVYSRIGTGIDVDFFIEKVGDNAELQITNNEAAPVELVFARTKI